MSLTLIEFGNDDNPSRYHYDSGRRYYNTAGRLVRAEAAEVAINDSHLLRDDPQDLPLQVLWNTFMYAHRWQNTHSVFAEYLTILGATDSAGFCANCSQPAWSAVLNGQPVAGVCPACIAVSYYCCATCSGWFHPDDDHTHELQDGRAGCCRSPQLAFTIRNDGREPLANDTRLTVALPDGIISAEGLTEIQGYLYGYANDEYRRYRYREDTDEYQNARRLMQLTHDLEVLGDHWQTTRGNYTKRFSSHAFRTCQVKIPPEVLSQVGCIARDHSKSVSFTVEVTRLLNRRASYFYHAESCWWGNGGYGDSRCAFKTNGGVGMRSLSPHGSEAVTGRAWLLPLRKDSNGYLTPTFETLTPDAFVIFNGYGELNSYTAPRIVAHLTGWTYSRIDFECRPMYVNSGGYLVAPEDICRTVKDLSLSVPKHSDLFAIEQDRAKEAEKDNIISQITSHQQEHLQEEDRVPQ